MFRFALEKATLRAYLHIYFFFFHFFLNVRCLMCVFFIYLHILWSLFISRVKNAHDAIEYIGSFVGLRFHYKVRNKQMALDIAYLVLLIIIRSVVVCLHALITICSGKKNWFWQFQQIVRNKRKLRNLKLESSCVFVFLLSLQKGTGHLTIWTLHRFVTKQVLGIKMKLIEFGGFLN